MEILFEIIGQILFEVLFQTLVELGVSAVARGFAARGGRAGRVVLLVVVALSLGAGSTLFVTHAVLAGGMRYANLVISPILCGLLMSGAARLRAHKNKPVALLDSFGFGYLFALCFAVARFALTR